MNVIEDLNIDVLLGIIRKVKSEREERKAWEMWLQLYPHMMIPASMNSKPALKFIAFSEYYLKITTPISRRPKEDILDEAKRIQAAITARKEEKS